MDDHSNVLADCVLYVSKGVISAIGKGGEAPPADFEHAPLLDTGGTIYPGLIELHNHLSYNVLRLWAVPQLYANRDTWAGTPAYRSLISGPMGVLGRTPSLVPALVRFVECKCLLGGVTTSQGIALYSDAGIRHFYRGIVRNVEQTDDPKLPNALARIPDVAAGSSDAFWKEVEKAHSFLLHLSEGTNPSARKHFTDLNLAGVDPATAHKLVGIHCVALEASDLELFASKGCSMVWSPLSNLLLYGQTAHIAELKAAKVTIGIGSDWSPSGSKNLLGELKVAQLYSKNASGGPIFSDEEIIALATRNAAAILGWEQEIGSLETGKRADLIVIQGSNKDPYATLLEANERSIELVVIEGVPRAGLSKHLSKFTGAGEEVAVGGEKRLVNLAQETENPDVSKLTLAQATSMLEDALQNLPDLAKAPTPVAALAPGAKSVHPTWKLALDEIEDTHFVLRLPLAGEDVASARGPVEAAAPPVLTPLQLDPLTVADDPDFLGSIAKEPNLPPYLAPGLTELYS
jgi:hypothetical protein